MAIELTEGGRRRLAVSAGVATRGTALTRLLALRSSPGWLAAGDSIREWRFDAVLEHEGTVFLAGPYHAAEALQDVLLRSPSEALPLLRRLAQALLALSRGTAGWFPLQSDSILFTEAGEVLVLPPAIGRELREMRPFEQKRETFECLNHPDLTGERGAVYGMCICLYRVFTGRFPFSGADAEELHTRMRSLAVPAPSLLAPGLDEKASRLVMAGLGRGRSSLRLEDLVRAMEGWDPARLLHAPSAGQRESALRSARAREAAAGRTFRWQRFWQRNWRAVLIVAAVAIVVASLGGTVLRKALAPRLTHGDSPRQVVQTFYASMNTLDHQAMEACVTGGAGRQQINEVTTLYVTSRVTQGYEGQSTIVSAEEWDRQGRPSLVPPQVLYGVTGLALERQEGPPTPVFLVHYEKWNPAPRPENASDTEPVRSEGHAVTDRVWLKLDRGDWVIDRIERVSSQPLTPPGLAPSR